MKTLVNIINNSKIIVPDVTIGERYFMIDNKYLNIKYLIGSVYLDKDEWIIENN